MVFSHQTDVAPQLAVTKGSHCKHGNGAKQQATPEPRNAVVPFVFGDGPAKDGARYPQEKQRDQKTITSQSLASRAMAITTKQQRRNELWL